MGTYLNPGMSGFERMISNNYVDKTGLIRLINHTIGTSSNMTCISRPRRFGKSYTAQMLCAYYDKSCDSHDIFSPFRIANDETFEKHLNKYHVINLDVTNFISEARKEGISLREVPSGISAAIKREVEMIYPDIDKCEVLTDLLIELVNRTGTKIVFIIDEWDSMIREANRDNEAQERYLNLLRGWFKNNNFTPNVVAAAYMTGILPIKKDGSQSAISDFREYTILYPGKFAPYTGFTDTEVRTLCEEYGMSFEKAREWYDVYSFEEVESVYNPYSVMCAMQNRQFRSYWKQTSAAEALLTYIDMDEDGLQDDIARLISGELIEVDTESFQNDFATFKSKDDVLTLMIHLGYQAYEEDADEPGVGLVRIPNEEIRREFNKILRKGRHYDPQSGWLICPVSINI